MVGCQDCEEKEEDLISRLIRVLGIDKEDEGFRFEDELHYRKAIYNANMQDDE